MGLPPLRQKSGSSISRLPQFRHLDFTTSFGGPGSTRDVLVAPRVVERACCMYVSSASGEIAAPPPMAPPAPPITADMNALRSIVPPSPIRVKPNPQTAKGRYQPPGLTSPVRLLPLSGRGLMYESSWPAMSAEYRKTTRPAPIRMSPSTTIVPRRPDRLRFGRTDPRDTSRSSPPPR